jgi:hypothetical protein
MYVAVTVVSILYLLSPIHRSLHHVLFFLYVSVKEFPKIRLYFFLWMQDKFTGDYARIYFKRKSLIWYSLLPKFYYINLSHSYCFMFVISLLFISLPFFGLSSYWKWFHNSWCSFPFHYFTLCFIFNSVFWYVCNYSNLSLCLTLHKHWALFLLILLDGPDFSCPESVSLPASVAQYSELIASWGHSTDLMGSLSAQYFAIHTYLWTLATWGSLSDAFVLYSGHSAGSTHVLLLVVWS